jgi:ATP-dependent Clp endopeptidase proteolytic subunit ClpP
VNPFRSPQSAARTPIRAQAPTPRGSGSVSLRLYDPIDSWGGDWGVSAREFGEVLDALPDDTKEIRLLINSPGGEVWDGLAILNQLRSHPARFVAVVEGIAASAASFIAAGADELVMLRNSELFVHNAWGYAMGDAEVMREIATDLERLDRNIASVYAEKSGRPIDEWLALMGKDSFLSAEEAVEAGLADRIEGVADPAATAAKASLVTRFASADRGARAQAPTEPPPVTPATEPGDTNRKEQVAMSDDLLAAGLRERLGVTDADATPEQLLAAVDQALTAPPPPNPTLPEGTVLLDAAALEELRAAAEMGRQARAQQDSDRRDAIVASAVREGRIAPSSRDTWRAALDRDEAGTASLIGSLTAGAVPVAEIGHSDGTEKSDAERVYDQAWGTPAAKEA